MNDYVKVPENHIVIDFDIPDKGGAGIHLHYIYTGDVSKLSRVYDDHIEVNKKGVNHNGGV